MHVFVVRFTVPESDFRMTLKNGLGKCSLFVLSANEWKDQNTDSSFSLQENPNMEKALFDWPIVLQYPFDKPIKSLYFRSFVVSFLFARYHFKVTRKSL